MNDSIHKISSKHTYNIIQDILLNYCESKHTLINTVANANMNIKKRVERIKCTKKKKKDKMQKVRSKDQQKTAEKANKHIGEKHKTQFQRDIVLFQLLQFDVATQEILSHTIV